MRYANRKKDPPFLIRVDWSPFVVLKWAFELFSALNRRRPARKKAIINGKRMHIQPVQPESLTQISALAQRSKAHWGYSAEFMAQCQGELTYSVAQLQDPLAHFFAATIECRPVGFYVLVGLDEQRVELEALFVDPAYFGRGLGKRSWQHAVELGCALGYKSMLIHSDPFAEPFYLHMGAKRIGQRPSASIPGRQLPLLEMDLAPPVTKTKEDP